MKLYHFVFLVVVWFGPNALAQSSNQQILNCYDVTNRFSSSRNEGSTLDINGNLQSVTTLSADGKHLFTLDRRNVYDTTAVTMDLTGLGTRAGVGFVSMLPNASAPGSKIKKRTRDGKEITLAIDLAVFLKIDPSNANTVFENGLYIQPERLNDHSLDFARWWNENKSFVSQITSKDLAIESARKEAIRKRFIDQIRTRFSAEILALKKEDWSHLDATDADLQQSLVLGLCDCGSMPEVTDLVDRVMETLINNAQLTVIDSQSQQRRQIEKSDLLCTGS